jgi:glycerophosphoryl diester phosphodiesterase
MLVRKNNILVEIIAHRGASYIAPENTLTAINRAWEMKADGVEIDIQQTNDKRIILLHDENTKRTTGRKLLARETSFVELRKLDAGIFKSKEFAGQKIPSLEEVIKTIPQGKKLYVEIKCSEEIFPELQKIFINSGKMSQFVLMGFDLETVSKAKKIMPEIPVYWLCNTVRNKLTRKPVPYNLELIDKVIKNNLDGLSTQYKGISDNFAEKVLSSGIKLYAWTVNDIEEAKRLLHLGVHGIITDRPSWILNNFKGNKKG